jgi:hypothetical protein
MKTSGFLQTLLLLQQKQSNSTKELSIVCFASWQSNKPTGKANAKIFLEKQCTLNVDFTQSLLLQQKQTTGHNKVNICY